VNVEALVEAEELVLDDGCGIGGPYIPDGIVRIYDPEDCYNVLGSGETAEEAWDEYWRWAQNP
jgi:hypothetical protein